MCVCVCVCVCTCVCVLHMAFSVRGVRIHIFSYPKSFGSVGRHMVCIQLCVCVCVYMCVCVCIWCLVYVVCV